MHQLLDVVPDYLGRHPRVLIFIDRALPVLVALLLISTLLQVGRLSGVAEQAHQAAQANGRLARANHRFAVELREGLVASCQHNGNPLRRVVRSLLHQQIASSQRLPPSFFPGIPAPLYNRLVAQGIRENRRRLQLLHTVPCLQQYPAPAVPSDRP